MSASLSGIPALLSKFDQSSLLFCSSKTADGRHAAVHCFYQQREAVRKKRWTWTFVLFPLVTQSNKTESTLKRGDGAGRRSTAATHERAEDRSGKHEEQMETRRHCVTKQADCVYIRRPVLQYERRGGEGLKVQVFPHILPGRRRVSGSSSAILGFIFLKSEQRWRYCSVTQPAHPHPHTQVVRNKGRISGFEFHPGRGVCACGCKSERNCDKGQKLLLRERCSVWGDQELCYTDNVDFAFKVLRGVMKSSPRG